MAIKQNKDEFNKIIFSDAHLHLPPFKCSSVNFMAVLLRSEEAYIADFTFDFDFWASFGVEERYDSQLSS